jgi:hypothetical protein
MRLVSAMEKKAEIRSSKASAPSCMGKGMVSKGKLALSDTASFPLMQRYCQGKLDGSVLRCLLVQG